MEGTRLLTYIPKHLQAQHDKLVIRANKGRAQTPKQSSKIWLGSTEFELRFRPKGCSTHWNKIQPESEAQPLPTIPRQSLINERAQINCPKPATRTTNETWLSQYSNNNLNTPSRSRINNPNNIENPNLIPISGNRSKGNLIGERLLPRGITTKNRFDQLRDHESSP